MSTRYNQGFNDVGATRFTQAPMSEVEFSSMTANPTWYVPFNAGEIVPVYYSEVLPHDTFEIDLDFVIRQTSASLRPTMGKMQLDIYAFFVPNRIVNESWKNVQGENTSGFWTAPEVELAPLYKRNPGQTNDPDFVNIPIYSIADLYGFPSQQGIPVEVLEQCNDLKFRGYLEIYNNYFRSQDYEAPIPYSKLNIYNGFLRTRGYLNTPFEGSKFTVPTGTPSDGDWKDGGSVVKAVYGEGSTKTSAGSLNVYTLTGYSFLETPLKANKLHDAFTSVLPSPQKGANVYLNLADTVPVGFYDSGANPTKYWGAIQLVNRDNHNDLMTDRALQVSSGLLSIDPSENAFPAQAGRYNVTTLSQKEGVVIPELSASSRVSIKNAYADLSAGTGISINDLRMAISTQQVYETLARSGSRYWSFLKGFFGVEVNDPFPDIPTQLGHIRRDLDLYQVAQTSASESGSTPQGSLTAFGYTTKGGHLFTKTFLEHGYIHVFAVVRQRNVYSTYFAPDNFRRSTLDFYLPQFANIGEQPIRTAILNPFLKDSMETAIGYQEAWWEYRYEPDRVHGALRTGLPQALDVWHFADFYDSKFTTVNGAWLKSNARAVLDRTITTTSVHAPQFISAFEYKIKKQRPMPTYSVPGLDIL